MKSGDRYLTNSIAELCFANQNKMTLISGPRQCGKTTYAKHLLRRRGAGSYYNYDQREFRAKWIKHPQSLADDLITAHPKTPILVLDEIHKAKSWKRTLKGIFDTLDHRLDIVVTGSAKLDIFKKGSDSLLGRYFSFRLHPFTVSELLGKTNQNPDSLLQEVLSLTASGSSAHSALETIFKFGGFPEPLFGQSERKANAWRRLRLQQLVREDLRDLSRLPELNQIEMLMALLPERAGSQLSRTALREDMEVAYTTVSRWLSYMSAIYYHFELKPFSQKIIRSLKKEGKLYLWDYAEVPSPGARFENLIAQHLLKACHYWTDSGFGSFELNYLKNADGAEIDFILTKNKRPWLPIEVKFSDTRPSPHWHVFLRQINVPVAVQLVKEPKDYMAIREYGNTKLIICSAARFLTKL